MADISEPPDGTRLEFESGTDVYAAWRDDETSRRAGYPVGDGGEVWCVYGETVPKTWAQMIEEFGADALALAVRLVPATEDVDRYQNWPTEVMYRADILTVAQHAKTYGDGEVWRAACRLLGEYGSLT